MNPVKENDLINESSPYLLGHAHNPVNWHPWGENALKKAKDENKLMLISIGYSACHWCHVMERESFEDEGVARLMNQFFICIKVDREERPDIDQIYLEAVQVMTGHGGWPLNCFTLPDGKPLYGGTYFRKEDWKNILFNLAEYWKNKPDEALSYSINLTGALQNTFEKIKTVNPEILPKNFLEAWIPYLDSSEGGFLGSPKFPLPNSWIFLIKLIHAQKSSENRLIEDFIHHTLSRMADGGIYDQLGGGFARYSTDTHWFAPHFEKMLYDNAQLICLYADAFIINKDPEYSRVVRETIDFLKRDLLSSEGAFYSALDADSEGVEGKYYVWTKNELKRLLGSHEPVFSLYYHIKPDGNWEGSNILFKRPISPPLHEKIGLSKPELMQEIEACKRTLLTHRYARISPALDDKILCAWNALMIDGLCSAYKALGNKVYLKMAIQTSDFLLNQMVKEDAVYRTYKNGISKIKGFLDDYSFLAKAFISLYQVSFEPVWIYRAENLLNQILQKFKDPESSLFFYTDSSDTPLIARKKEIQDSVIPSSNSVLAQVFFALGHYLNNDSYREIAGNMIAEVQNKFLTYAPSYSNWSSLALEISQGAYEITIIGSKVEEFRINLEKSYIPFKLISGSNVARLKLNDENLLPVLKDKVNLESNLEGKTLIYVCRNSVCSLPFESVKEALNFINGSF